MEFTNQEFKSFRKDFDKTMGSLAEKYALAITSGNISYGTDEFSMKIKCMKTDCGDINKKEFENYCMVLGLMPGDYKSEFMFKGAKYVLEALSVRSSKYPCICTMVGNGKSYKFPVDIVKEALSKSNDK